MRAPRMDFNIIDNMVDNGVRPIDEMPLDNQIFFFISQRGLGNIPKYYPSITNARRELGDQTFNENNTTYFSESARFFRDLFAHTGAWGVRLEPADAKASSKVLWAVITEGDVNQYLRNEDGSFQLDGEGVKQAAVPATAPGVKVKLEWRDVTGGKTYATEDSTTGAGIHQIPILGLEAVSKGKWGDLAGLKLYVDEAENKTADLLNIGSVRVTMEPVEKAYSNSTVKEVRDAFNAVRNSFCLVPDMIDDRTNLNNSMDVLLGERYPDALLPYKIHAYSDNVVTAANLCKAVQADLSTVDSEKINFFSCIDLRNGYPYTHIVVDETGEVLEPDTVHYLGGGADGDLSPANVEALTLNYMQGNTYPAIKDKARYPFKAVIDTGYSKDVKFAIFDMLDLRSDIMVGVGTHINGNDPLTEAEDLAFGRILYNYALLHQENLITGTAVCRAAIMTQSGPIKTSLKKQDRPMTYWLSQNMGRAFRGTVLNEPMTTHPYSLNELFDTDGINWTPYEDDFKDSLYANGLNYCQYFDMDNVFYPALQTCYPYRTSKLNDFYFVYTICHIQALAYRIWTIMSGSEEEDGIRHGKIEDEINDRIGRMLAGKYKFTVNISQTYDENALGIDHIRFGINADKSVNTHYFDLILG